MEQTSYYTALLAAWLDNSLPADKAHELFDFIRDEPEIAGPLLGNMGGEHYIRLVSEMEGPDPAIGERMRQRLQLAVRNPVKVRRLVSGGRRWAAAILLLLSATWFWTHRSASGISKTASSQTSAQDIAPGGNKATLTLSDGNKIDLDSAAIGQLAQQGSSRIVKGRDGRIAYQPLPRGSGVTLYNTLSTPRGGQYQLTLPDGTKVWLNAASSIRFPTAFSGKERKVSITGEAYFEVAKNKEQPFLVQKGGLTVQVLGTAFNLNAYEDEEAVRTTLIAGSVKVISGQHSTILQPGQQAVLRHNNSTIRISSDANIEEVMAWKNGLFRFDRSDLKTVMRQLSRWYDVDIGYEGNIPPQEFGGKIGRDLNLSEVLEGLAKSQVHFRIEGKKLIVMP